jgi:uncharacterized protein YcbX
VSVIVKDLFVYPIKSFRGVRLDMMKVDDKGPEHDRQFLLVGEDNKFLTQRQMPELAKIGLRMIDDAFIELSQPGFGEVDFGLNEYEEGEFHVTVWDDQVPASEVNADISGWLSEVLKKKVKLVRIADKAKRNFDPEAHEGRDIRFSDGTPFLVISTASLKMLELKAKVSLSMTRFRPNIVVDGVEAHSEDEWGGFQIGKIQFDPLHRCTRCKVTTVHPLTGVVGKEPLQTLGTYRRGNKGIEFGMYYAHLAGGTIRIGDTLTVT